MVDYFNQSVCEVDIRFIVTEITAFKDCIETRQMLIDALQLSPSIGVDLEQKYRYDGFNSYNYFTGVISKWINWKGNKASTEELDKALRSIGWNAAADNVMDKWFGASRSGATEETNTSNVSISKQLNKPIWFNMRDPISSFTGRDDTLEKVHDVLFPAVEGQQGKSHDKIKSTQVAIVGLGGIGKSEFARKFAKVYYTEFHRNVAWMNAESAQLLQESFKELAAEIGIDTTNVSGKKNFRKMIKSVYEHFSKSNSLFIFDNVEAWFDGEDPIMDYLPIGLKPDSRLPYILMTSRNRPKVSKSVAIVNLFVLTETEAVRLIQYRLDSENSEFPLKLAKLLGCLPLALQQAISYIQQEIDEDISGMARQEVVAKCIHYYIEIFDSEAKKLLDYKYRNFDVATEELKTTRVTWRITLDKIRGINLNAFHLLNMVSYVSPDNIHLEMFDAQFVNAELKAAINTLLDFSMITKHSTNSSVISVHRLVQRVVRLDEQNKSLESMLYLLDDILNQSSDSITPYTTSCVIHAQVAWRHALGNPILLKQFNGYLKKLFDKCRIHEMLQSYLSLIQGTLLKYDEYNIFEDTSEQYMEIQYLTAWAMLRSHNYEDAKLLYNSIQKTAARELGESHPLTLDIMNDTGNVEGKLGNYSEQMIILDKVIAIRTATPNMGPYHKDTLIALHNKAVCLARMKKYDEALEIFKSTLELKKKYYSGYRDSINITRYWIARTIQLQGNFAESLQMYTSLHAERVYSVGKGHTRTLQCAIGIGGCLLNLGRHEDAMEILKHNMELANENPSARIERFRVHYSIATVLFYMERYDEAISQFRIVLDEESSVYGETHPDVLLTREQLAAASENAGCTDEALEHYKFVYENREKTLGAEHPDTIEVKESLAKVLFKMERYEEAIGQFRIVLDEQTNIYGETHPKVLTRKVWLAIALQNAGYTREGLGHFKFVYENRVKILGVDHPDTVESKKCIEMMSSIIRNFKFQIYRIRPAYTYISRCARRLQTMRGRRGKFRIVHADASRCTR